MMKSEIIKLILLLLLIASASIVNGQINLSGNWELRKSSPTPDGVVNMSISQSGSDLFASGNGWTGQGKLVGMGGFYNWVFTDGRKGKTSFTYNPEFDILVSGVVHGSGISWKFTANRTSTAAVNFNGTWYSPTFDKFIIINQRGNYVEGFFEAIEGGLYGDAAGNRVFSTFSGSKGSGILDMYKSVDGSKILIYRWYTSPSLAFGTAIYNVAKGQLTASPPAGWIASDLSQGCVSCFTGQRLGLPSICMDPRTQTIIDAWLAQTRPFDNWNKAQYDCWGRWYGESPGAVTTNRCLTPDTDGRSRCEYVLYFFGNTYSKELKSTLLFYVKKHLKN